MIDKNQAKSKFRLILILLIVGFFWPIIGLVLGLIADFAGLGNTGVIVMTLTFVWLALFVWLFVELWKGASGVGVSPWASLWVFFPVAGIFLVGMLILEPLKYTADDKPENQRLPYTWSLIKETWLAYVDNFKTSLKISHWFIYLFTALGILTGLTSYFIPDWLPWVVFSLMIPIAIGSIWISLMLLKQQISLENKELPVTNLKNNNRDLLSYLLIVLLMILIAGGPLFVAITLVIAPIFTGSWNDVATMLQMGDIDSFSSLIPSLGTAGLSLIGLALMPPAWLWLIYKGTIWNNLAMPLFVTENIKGYNTLKTCEKIAHGRWWGLYWKNQMAGLIFGSYALMISLGMNVAAVIVGMILKSMNLGPAAAEVLGNTLNGVVQMITMPLIILFTLKLFRAFRRTSN